MKGKRKSKKQREIILKNCKSVNIDEDLISPYSPNNYFLKLSPSNYFLKLPERKKNERNYFKKLQK